MVKLAIFLLILGMTFLMIELFIPGFGVFGIIGIISTGISFYLTVVYVPMGLFIIAVELFAIGFLLYIVYIVLKNKQQKDGLILYDTSAAIQSEKVDFSSLVGKEAKTTTSLRPMGTIELNNKSIEVTARGDYIPPKTDVRITKIEGKTIYVEKLGN